MQKFFGYLVLFVCISLDFFNANAQQKDLAIYFDVEDQPKARFYKHVMQDSVGFPANRTVDPYHVTLLIVADVKDKDYSELASRLKNAVNKSTSSFSFTAHKASLLSNGNGANGNRGTVILEPLPQEKIRFQTLNQQLVDVLARYNGEQGVSYGIRSETNPSRYNPHLSIAKKEVFDKHSFLNRQGVVQTVNQALSGARNTDIAKMLSSKPQVKDLWAELKGASRTVPVQPINPLPEPRPVTPPAPEPVVLPASKPAPLPAPRSVPVVKRKVAAKRPVANVSNPTPQVAPRSATPQKSRFGSRSAAPRSAAPQKSRFGSRSAAPRSATPQKSRFGSRSAAPRSAAPQKSRFGSRGQAKPVGKAVAPHQRGKSVRGTWASRKNNSR